MDYHLIKLTYLVKIRENGLSQNLTNYIYKYIARDT